MRINDQSDHQFHSSIEAQGITLVDVLVKAFLPKRMADPLKLVLCPSKEQVWQLMPLFEFAIKAEVRGFSGEVEVIFESKKVYSETKKTKYWGIDLQESNFEATPCDFEVRRLRKHHEVPTGKVIGRFWITQCSLLSPEKMLEHWYTGEVKVINSKRLEFSLCNGLCLRFDYVYRHLKMENGDHVTFPELVANFEDIERIFTTGSIPGMCLDALDDFLLICSFAARRRSLCLGWEATDAATDVTFYRRGLTIPEASEDQSQNDTLIEKQAFEAFIAQAYSGFQRIETKEFIRQAFFAVTADDATIEMNFMRLFSALETLVLKHRRENDGEFVLPLEEWKDLQQKLKQTLKDHKALAEEKAKRAQIYEKLAELNRISFATAFEGFCRGHGIKLDDLWPVCGKQDTMSLVAIRNRLVHGEPFTHKHLLTLAKASHHLKWILERALLSLLGWPVQDSRVSEDCLRSMTDYTSWRGSSIT